MIPDNAPKWLKDAETVGANVEITPAAIRAQISYQRALQEWSPPPEDEK